MNFAAAHPDRAGFIQSLGLRRYLSAMQCAALVAGNTVSEALAYAAPVVGTALPDVSSSVENSGNPHTASVSELNPLTSTMLFTTVPVKTCKLLLMLLLRRAWPLYRIETREVTREDFATNLLTYINVSIISDFELSRRTSLTFSNTYLW